MSVQVLLQLGVKGQVVARNVRRGAGLCPRLGLQGNGAQLRVAAPVLQRAPMRMRARLEGVLLHIQPVFHKAPPRAMDNKPWPHGRD